MNDEKILKLMDKIYERLEKENCVKDTHVFTTRLAILEVLDEEFK